MARTPPARLISRSIEFGFPEGAALPVQQEGRTNQSHGVHFVRQRHEAFSFFSCFHLRGDSVG